MRSALVDGPLGGQLAFLIKRMMDSVPSRRAWKLVSPSHNGTMPGREAKGVAGREPPARVADGSYGWEAAIALIRSA
ncbi:protein of unknown function [Cupriavidus taiwanensis]|uniref:Uncharacterized protein n=1 Tax=Cupriavidus taiwanensis TaxID=164546 RepID=A0A7Z7J8V2_9BURK|nr:protein of unknown function [Cupriavidus taiwanensis]SOZ06017.1 hypothetical protein CBM2595_A80702 [Cupriavidus taiwanensis]SOZ08003.1 hypothetical protein CBM2597_A90609 [Cupriavidus taiwanensis]SPC16041.1 hypothetical protein CBM2594_A70606 [Cupriavidus taiwanensis]SPD40760.1 protein of unknown function [Cupriavidus taiwanensis]